MAEQQSIEFSSKCLFLLCLVSWMEYLNFSPHDLHITLFSPEWIVSWYFNVAFVENPFSQTLQLKCFVFCASLTSDKPVSSASGDFASLFGANPVNKRYANYKIKFFCKWSMLHPGLQSQIKKQDYNLDGWKFSIQLQLQHLKSYWM